MKKQAEPTRMTLREHYSMFPNQAEAADDLGVTTNSYQLWLSGKYSPCFKYVQMLARRGIKLESFPD